MENTKKIKEPNKVILISIKDNYYLSPYAYGYQLLKEVLGNKGKDNEHLYYPVVAYSSKISGIINLAIRNLIHDKVEKEELKTLEEIVVYFKKVTKEITEHLLVYPDIEFKEIETKLLRR